ncbi:MAG: protein YgfX [Rhodanobacteraceae bacterium]
MRTPPSIGFAYRPSRLLAFGAVCIALLALVAVVSSGISAWLAAVLFLLAAVYGCIALWRFLHPPIRSVLWRGDGGVSITLASQKGSTGDTQGELREARLFGPLIVLSLRWPRGSAALWLLPDNLDADTRRRLRIRLSTDGARLASVNADSI